MRFIAPIFATFLWAFILSEEAQGIHLGADKLATDKPGSKGDSKSCLCNSFRNLIETLTGGDEPKAAEPIKCPKVDKKCPDAKCKDECGDADNMCPDGKICCAQGTCGNKCVDPTTDDPPYGDPGVGKTCKPPMCPSENSLTCSASRKCFDDCGGEKKCKDPRRICCKSNCGNQCALPIYEGSFGTKTDEVSCKPMCPAEKDLACRATRKCYDDCGGDKKCKKADRLCCKSNCGNQCAQPIFKGSFGTQANDTSC